MASRTKAVRKELRARARGWQAEAPAPPLPLDHRRKTASKATAGAAKASVAATLKPRQMAARLSFCSLNDCTDSSISSRAHIHEARAIPYPLASLRASTTIGLRV